MKLRHLIGISTLFMLLLVIHACSTDYTLSEDDEKLEIRKATYVFAAGDYCRYNVTESSVPNMKAGSIVCYPCPPSNDCAESITTKPFTKIITDPSGKKDTITQGHVSGDLGNSSGKCDSCPSDGKKSAT